MKFIDMGLSPTTLAALEKKWFESPSPIQAQCIPLLMSGTKDIIWQAQTGTWKTAAFAIPVIEKIDPKHDHVQAVVIAPTRELAIQVANEINTLRGAKKISVVQVYGWAPMGSQLKQLRNWAHIVVWTPWRMIDMINRGKLKLGKINFCILDEADEMLNMWFLDEIESILDACNPERQMLCFSATMPSAIKRVAEKYMGEYNLIKVESKQLTTRNVEKLRMHLRQSDKLQALTRVIDAEPEFYGIVFCKTKRWCDELVHALQTHGYFADAMHGDMNQKQRELALKKFKKKQTMLMIATDVAARGIDVDDLSHVVNYDMPQDSETYTHRIWRTWRAWKQWVALTFVTKKDERKIRWFERAIKSEILKVEVPSIDSVIKLKKKRIVWQILDSLPEESSNEHEEIITQLLENNTEKQVIEGLLKIAYGKQLDTRNYTKIKAVTTSKERDNGQIRLFVARGRDSGINGPRELVHWLQDESWVDQSVMDDIAIKDGFSFVSLPEVEAMKVVDVFASKPWRSLVTVSKQKDGRWKGRARGSKKKFGKWSRKENKKHHGHKKHHGRQKKHKKE